MLGFLQISSFRLLKPFAIHLIPTNGKTVIIEKSSTTLSLLTASPFMYYTKEKKKENRKMKKRIRNRLSILRSKAGRCVSIQSSLLGFELLCFLNSSNVIFVSCVRTTFWHYCYLPVEHTVTEKENPSRKMKIACSIAGVCKCGVPQDDIFT